MSPKNYIQTDVENAEDYRIDTILRVSVGIGLTPWGTRTLIVWGPASEGLTHDDGQADRRRKHHEGFPVDVFGQDQFENALAWLMRCTPPLSCSRHHSCFSFGI